MGHHAASRPPPAQPTGSSLIAAIGAGGREVVFRQAGAGLSLSIAAAGTAAFAYQYLQPNVLYEPSPVVNEGKPDRYSLDSVTLDVNAGIYIIHSQEGFFSLSAVCTHLGLPDGVETGVGNHRLPVPRQQVLCSSR